jgi:F-type H+-transporting ATPase subunit a
VADPIHQFIVERIHSNPIIVNGFDISFTNSALWMVIGAVLSTTFLTVAMRKGDIIPNRTQMLAEMLYEFVLKMVSENIGLKGRKYFPFVFTLFLFVLMGNLLGLLPYAFTYTSHLVVTGTLALMVIFAVIIFGVINHGLHFFSLFVPSGVPKLLLLFIVPLEMVSFFVRPLTLSVRLFANMMAGHIVLKVILSFAVSAASLGAVGVVLGFLPVFANAGMLMFELLVAVVQAYVFAILACVYLKDSVDIHH